MAKHLVSPVASFPPGTQQRVEVDGKAIAVYNVDGKFFALRDICPHMGGPLSAGEVVGQIRASRPGCYEYRSERPSVRCPWHGWEYELETGRSWFDPARNRVRAYPVSVERQPGPYTAETVPVSVEDDFVVVEV